MSQLTLEFVIARKGEEPLTTLERHLQWTTDEVISLHFNN